jgi:hypothetical protein
MQCTENDFTSDFWEQSPVNERSNALELLVLVTLKPLLLRTPVHYIHVFKSKCPV